MYLCCVGDSLEQDPWVAKYAAVGSKAAAPVPSMEHLQCQSATHTVCAEG